MLANENQSSPVYICFAHGPRNLLRTVLSRSTSPSPRSCLPRFKTLHMHRWTPRHMSASNSNASRCRCLRMLTHAYCILCTCFTQVPLELQLWELPLPVSKRSTQHCEEDLPCERRISAEMGQWCRKIQGVFAKGIK